MYKIIAITACALAISVVILADDRVDPTSEAEKEILVADAVEDCKARCFAQGMRCAANCPADNPDTEWDEWKICRSRCFSGMADCQARCEQ